MKHIHYNCFLILIIVNLLIIGLFKLEFIFYLIPMSLLIFQIKSVKTNNNSKNLSLFKLNNYYERSKHSTIPNG